MSEADYFAMNRSAWGQWVGYTSDQKLKNRK